MKWEDEAYVRRDGDGNHVSLDEYVKDDTRVPTKKILNLSIGDLKLFAITGVGFFLDSYDLFIINLVTPIWQYEYWGGLDHQILGGPIPKTHEPPLLRGLVNAGSNIGNIIGQLVFGYLGDTFGRKFVYGKELIVCCIGTIMVISLPNNIPTPTLKMAWLFCFRLLMGIGVGGDYPISASIVSERSSLATRGQLLAWIFSNQGWGTLAGSVVTIIILACFSTALDSHGHYSQLDAVWRIQMGLGLVPAFATLWSRLTMPEGKKFLQSKELNTPSSSNSSIYKQASAPQDIKKKFLYHSTPRSGHTADPVYSSPTVMAEEVASSTPAASKYSTFFVYFKKWSHLKTLIGTASCWFLLDIAFYGVNLNQSVLLSDIGFSTGKNEYHVLMRNAYGNLIIASAGYVPGYFFTIYFVEKLGRRWIQIQGFLICALMFAVLAGDYGNLGTAPKFVCFAIAQFFFNFGPNATTFITAAEVFPSRVRGTAMGLSAAIGKLGAILSALLFNYLSGPTVIGLANVLWIFFACNLLGAILTFFLLPETTGKDADVIDFEEWQAQNDKSLARAAHDHTAGKKGVWKLLASMIPRGGE
ncbi:hypothetical protein LTR97_004193 [Elasticomyces elasticus]|uniref:Major facilitator superfamily (MFS) profile domain-containing protein n=1 Tax=Elasticomyces elasticus TaxID=574655 RepID=A0AAN8A3G9_9PEZI|nr:hypothetical protein LTR97_004193 [Elasticomyces elasticus]